MDKNRIIYAALSGVASLAFTLAPVMAASASNDTTGSDSDNDATVNLDNDTTINQTNNLTVHNNIDVDSDTGDNDANDNTGDGRVITGDAEAEVGVTTARESSTFDV